MMKYLSLLLISISLTQGAVEYLPRGMKMKYHMPTDYDMAFEWWIPSAYLEPYDWIGFAIQDPKYPRNDFQADYYIAFTSEGKFLDYYSDYEGSPVLDTELGGTNDIQSSYVVDHGKYKVFTLLRAMNTGDVYDTVLIDSRPYMIKWAMGIVNGTEILRHNMDDLGFEYLVFSHYYEDRNHDEYELYGPYLDYPPEFNNPPEEQKEENYQWSVMIEEDYTGKVFTADNIYISDGDAVPTSTSENNS